jgi:hypothetical protein
MASILMLALWAGRLIAAGPPTRSARPARSSASGRRPLPVLTAAPRSSTAQLASSSQRPLIDEIVVTAHARFCTGRVGAGLDRSRELRRVVLGERAGAFFPIDPPRVGRDRSQRTSDALTKAQPHLKRILVKYLCAEPSHASATRARFQPIWAAPDPSLISW